MSRIVAELSLTPDACASHPAVPAAVIGYGQAFFRTSRDSLRFLYRHDEAWLSIHLARDRTHCGGDRATLRVAEVEMPRGITVRETDILTLLTLGLTNAGIAERLGTSARTVSTQIERLLAKLDQDTRGGLSALAVDSGLIRLPIPGGVDGRPGIGVVELEKIVTGVPRIEVPPLRPAYPGRRPLLVGVLIPTGAAAADGIEVRQGSTLAMEELNATGGVAGRRVDLVTAEVDVFSWDSVQRGLGQLFAHDVDAITTSYASAEHSGVIDLVADYGKPFLHTATFAEQVEQTEADPARFGAVLQTCASETFYGMGMVRLLTDLQTHGRWRPRSRRIVCIEAATSSTQVTTEPFLATADRAGWSVDELIRVPIGSIDWSRVAARLAALDPEVVMVTHFLDQEVAAFHREFVKLGLPALVYCVYGPSIPQFQATLGVSADGVIWSTTTGTYDDVLGQRFRSQYTARFGRPPGWSQAGAAYDRVNLLAAAWAATSNRDAADVVRYLRRWPHRGVNGVYYFGERNHATLSYPDVTPDASIGQAHMIYQIQGGTHRALAPEPFGSVSRFVLPSWCVSR
ncbi:branched-chain amino acid transport system substrate-binding protein [Mycobacterium frederiksbergense]|uniref:Branched-chain amino acid transport system substrate-binding protein n=1 Tax=Mycolicibacterium frederiksbergense TaxID=117567 RepID=A0ABT6L360_9MYCO|nr:ABC transporter substrate-binding protein [Mycolicibacterium frederiksbergense]MDH6197385.1 branched-chain amino acid transport system substrate-binding protein [Mycolicibacterium frederiksbergense]